MKKNLLAALTASLFLVVAAQAQKPSGGGQSQGTSASSSTNANGNMNGSTNRQPDMDSLIRQGTTAARLRFPKGRCRGIRFSSTSSAMAR
jgi:hypothetical protein